MEKTSKSTITYLMEEISKTCAQILAESNEELIAAKEKNEKEKFVDFIQDVKTLEMLIKVSDVISLEVQKSKLSTSTQLLLQMTAANATRMLHSVATKRSLHKQIIARFKEADAIMSLN